MLLGPHIIVIQNLKRSCSVIDLVITGDEEIQQKHFEIAGNKTYYGI